MKPPTHGTRDGIKKEHTLRGVFLYEVIYMWVWIIVFAVIVYAWFTK